MIEAIDLRLQFPGARDQGARPTCLAFAVSDAHLFAANRPGLLSAEYLHFQAAQHASVNLNAAVGVGSIMDALRVDGQPLESECPYVDPRPDSWTPPSKYSAIWTRRSSLVSGKASEALESGLMRRRCLVLVIRISRSFHAPSPSSYIVHEDGGKDRRLHAVVIVGMAPVASTDAFVARNSWGAGWGQHGHAWLPFSYVDARAVDVLEVEVESP